MEESIKFHVQGSVEEPYIVHFIKKDEKLIAFCTCNAGENRMHCKHRINILEGNSENVVSTNIGDIDKVLSWLPGTELEIAWKAVESAETLLKRAKNDLTKAKRKLARIMHNLENEKEH